MMFIPLIFTLITGLGILDWQYWVFVLLHGLGYICHTWGLLRDKAPTETKEMPKVAEYNFETKPPEMNSWNPPEELPEPVLTEKEWEAHHAKRGYTLQFDRYTKEKYDRYGRNRYERNKY